MTKLICTALATFGLAAGASAALSTWTGALSNAWSTGFNWSGGVPSGASASALINANSNAARQPVFSSGTITIDDITISRNAGTPVNAALTVSGGSLTCDAVLIEG